MKRKRSEEIWREGYLRSIAEGLADAEAGRLMTTKELLEDLLSRDEDAAAAEDVTESPGTEQGRAED